MDEGSLASLALLVILMVLHGGMELSYAALTNFRHMAVRERADDGDRQAQRILSLADDIPRLYITAQLYLMFMRFIIVVVTTVRLVQPLIQTNPTLAPEIAYPAVLLPVALLTFFIGSHLPWSLGNAYADQLVGLIAGPTRLVMLLFTPLIAVSLRISHVISRLSGSENLEKAVTEEEIMTLVDVGQKGGTIEDEEKEMIYSVLQFGETLARELMIPRPDIVAVDVETRIEDALGIILESGHSRIPVYQDSIDNIKGMLYAKDLLSIWHQGTAAEATIARVMRPAYFVPQTKRADVLFKEMQTRNTHIALIVDEYGGTAGLVTIEDLIEEIVGDIRDEYDINEGNDLVSIGSNEFLVDGSMNLDDLNDQLDTDLPTDETDSIGGFIYSYLGRVPEIGEALQAHGLLMRIEDVENRRIRKIHITRLSREALDAYKETGEMPPVNGQTDSEDVALLADVIDSEAGQPDADDEAAASDTNHRRPTTSPDNETPPDSAQP
ncbi:MAG: HlyC/CorC family transporter [Chloroflexi bacterium]|nr:HlyC/CorC family transporter [Chloroflexota bacterium]